MDAEDAGVGQTLRSHSGPCRRSTWTGVTSWVPMVAAEKHGCGLGPDGWGFGFWLCYSLLCPGASPRTSGGRSEQRRFFLPLKVFVRTGGHGQRASETIAVLMLAPSCPVASRLCNQGHLSPAPPHLHCDIPCSVSPLIPVALHL